MSAPFIVCDEFMRREICVSTELLEVLMLPHAERGESFQNQDFVGECRTDGASRRPYFWRKFEFRILAGYSGSVPEQ